MQSVTSPICDTQHRDLDILETEDLRRMLLVVKERIRRVFSVLVSAILGKLDSIEVTFDCVFAPAGRVAAGPAVLISDHLSVPPKVDEIIG